MTKKVLCAVDDTEHAKSAVALATELAKATGAELTLLVVNVPMGARGRVGLEIYACEDADLKRVLDGGAAIAKKAGVSDPKTESVKAAMWHEPSSYMPRKTTLTTLSSEQVAKAGRRG